MPRAGRIEFKSRVGIRDGEDGRELEEICIRESKSRRICITQVDVDKYKIAPGCKGCIALDRGKQLVMHRKDCRNRKEEIIMDKEPV